MGTSSSRINERQSKKLYKSLVRINFILNEKETIEGTGFFIKFNIKNKTRYFIMTCLNIIKERFVYGKKVINFYDEKNNEERHLEIKLDRDKRLIKCFDEPYYVTMV